MQTLTQYDIPDTVNQLNGKTLEDDHIHNISFQVISISNVQRVNIHAAESRIIELSFLAVYTKSRIVQIICRL